MSASGMRLTVLATGLATAVEHDTAPHVGGFDLSAGMFGPHVSAWLREVAAELSFDETRERTEFEEVCYQHYLDTRRARLAQGRYGILDEPDHPHASAELFRRHANGEYVALVYQHAWGGWKLARGWRPEALRTVGVTPSIVSVPDQVPA